MREGSLEPDRARSLVVVGLLALIPIAVLVFTRLGLEVTRITAAAVTVALALTLIRLMAAVREARTLAATRERALGGLLSEGALHDRELEREQLKAYADDVRASYARELRGEQDLQDSYLATVRALAAAVEAKDSYTGGPHSPRARARSAAGRADVAPSRRGSAGCVRLPAARHWQAGGLRRDPRKPGKLSRQEWALMHTHPVAGGRILAPVPFLDGALDVVLHHHERWDGGGYPHGLPGERIPLAARIFAVVDTVDAITSDRPYRAGRPLEVPVDELHRESGRQFDPACVEAFCAIDSSVVDELLEHRPAVDIPHGLAMDVA